MSLLATFLQAMVYDFILLLSLLFPLFLFSSLLFLLSLSPLLSPQHILTPSLLQVKVNPSPSFILYGGDAAAHALGHQSIKAIQTVTSAFEVAFPGVPVYFTLGNNDVPEVDYEVRKGERERERES